MIDEDKTMEMFGYHAYDFTSKSDKKVVVVCEGCGDSRILRKGDFTRLKNGGLCHSCSHKDILHTDETKAKISVAASNRSDEWRRLQRLAHLGHKASDDTRKLLSSQRVGENHWNFGKHHSIETLKLMSDVKIGKMLGADNPNWKGGITDENQMFYHSTEYNQWRSSIFERDNFTCQECGSHTSGYLNAHHILPYRDWREPQYSLNPSNGITLCKRCHRETYGCEYDSFSKYFDLVHGITQLTLTR